MQAHDTNAEEFLNARTRFTIPVYQRNYEWTKSSCRRLFEDILATSVQNRQHFLGIFCFQTINSRERSIIDGQQRITSLTLLLMAISHCISDEELQQDISRNFLTLREASSTKTSFIPKLRLNHRDDQIYRLLLENKGENAKEGLKPRQLRSAIYQNYLLFRELFTQYVKNGGSALTLYDAIRNLTLVELEIRGENPQEIFESLNATGRSLTNVDLLRNFLFMPLDAQTQQQLYEQSWSAIEDAVDQAHIEAFFADYLLFARRSAAVLLDGKRSTLSESNLYPAFKAYVSQLSATDATSKTKEVLQDMKRAALLYRRFLFEDDEAFHTLSKDRQLVFFLLKALQANGLSPLLLYVYSAHADKLITTSELTAALGIMLTLATRTVICGIGKPSQTFAGNVMLRLDRYCKHPKEGGFIPAFWSAITFGKGGFAFPTDEDFKKALLTRDLYHSLHSQGIKYLFYYMEMQSDFAKGLPAYEDASITVEHIMPRSLNAQWMQDLNENDLAQHVQMLHRLGNLALTTYNAEMSNKAFSQKRPLYEKTNFPSTRSLCRYETWNTQTIQARSQSLASLALSIWNYPAKYQKRKQTRPCGRLFALLDVIADPEQFSHQKPCELWLDDVEVLQIASWQQLFVQSLRFLAKIDSDAFMRLAERYPRLLISAEKRQDERLYTHIAYDLYIRNAKNAPSILRALYRIVSAFDDATGSDYLYHILFVLQ